MLDLRDTFVGDSVISSFSHTSTLTEIYLESPSSGTVQHQPDEHLQLREVVYVQLQRGPEAVYVDGPPEVCLLGVSCFPSKKPKIRNSVYLPF